MCSGYLWSRTYTNVCAGLIALTCSQGAKLQGALRIECCLKIPIRAVEILGSELRNVSFHNIGVFLSYDVGFKLPIKSEKASFG